MANTVATLRMEQKFKKTLAGEIPVDWEVATFGESFQFLRTANNSRSDLSSLEKVGYIHYGDIHTKWRTTLRCDHVKLPKIKPAKVERIPRLRDGDLVMADASEDYDGLGVAVEVCNVGDQEIVAGLHTFLLRDRGGQFADGFRGYIQYIPAVRQRLIEAATGVSVYGLSKGRLADVPIPRPPLGEQKKIAEILSAVDAAIEKTGSVIEKTQHFKNGLMQRFITKGTGEERTKGSLAGTIPYNWNVVPLQEVCQKIQDGTHFSPKSKDGPYMYVTSKNIRMGRLDLTDVARISTEEHREIYRRADIKFGDVLLTKDGAQAGNITINTIQEEFSLLSSVAMIRPDPQRVCSEWIYQFYASAKGRKILRNQISGLAITRLTLDKIKKLPIALPSMHEQKKITRTLGAVDNAIQQQEHCKEVSLRLKKSLMHVLLTGRVRM
ncbi:MAG: hypothetical protein A3G41_01800 [Elusimicrobia bacterium RIFCSPLOWO2_12_FULL_59_9]|nr:MAG: hypothetical protein A3G41_01800 [Elusimicrobia bacterium RIFCSPLOWO2_12_FULL_59_9]